MEQPTGVDQQDDLFWDENTQMMLRRSGVAHWREVLAERAQRRAESADRTAELLDRLRRGLPPTTA